MLKTKVPKKIEVPQPDVPLSQIISDREVSMEKTADSIEWIQEEIKFKDDQLDSEIIEENNSQLYTLLSFPINKKKPRHVLKIEVAMLKKAVKGKEKTLKIMKELQVEDKKKEEKNASKPL